MATGSTRTDLEIFDFVAVSIIVRDMEGRITFWNAASETLYGWTQKDALGQHAGTLLRSEVGAEPIESTLSKAGGWQGQLIRSSSTGVRLVIDSSWSVRHDAAGLPCEIIETGIHVTVPLEKLEKAQLTEARFRTLFESVAVAFWEIDVRGAGEMLAALSLDDTSHLREHLLNNRTLLREILKGARTFDANKRTLQLFGAESIEDFVGVDISTFWPQQSETVLIEVLVAAMERRAPLMNETQLLTLKGEKVDVLFSCSRSPESDKRSVLLIGIIDVSDQKRAIAQVERSERQFRNIFDRMPIAFWQIETGALHTTFKNLRKKGVKSLIDYAETDPKFLPKLLDLLVVTDVNDHTVKMLGASSRDALLGPLTGQWANASGFLAACDALYKGDQAINSESTIVTRDGRTIDILRIAILEQNGVTIVSAIDVTERRKAADELARSEQQYRSLFNYMPIALWQLESRHMREMFDQLHEAGVDDLLAYVSDHPEFLDEAQASLRITEANEYAVQLFGADNREDLIAKMPGLWIDRNDWAAAAIARISGKSSHSAEAKIITLGGDEVDVIFSVAFADRTNPESYNMVGAIDISELKRTANALSQNELKYRNLFQHMPLSLCQLDVGELPQIMRGLQARGITDLDAYIEENNDFLGHVLQIVKIEQVNEHFVKMFGGRDPDEFVGPMARFWQGSENTIRRALVAHYKGAETYAEDTKIVTEDGCEIDVFFTSAFPEALGEMGIGLVGMIDVGDRVQAERRLQKVQRDFAHAARVATLGELTASIAHEVSQPLAAITTNGEASLRWLARPDPELKEVRNLARRMVNDARRAADVIAQIRAMAAGQALDSKFVDINATVNEVLAFLRKEFEANNVNVQFLSALCLPEVRVDHTQIQQVLVNLAINAIQAVASNPEAHRALIIRTLLDHRGNVRIEVDDNGPGIAAEHADNLFNSFFTTKEHGLGIGLSICRTIVEAHGGSIVAENQASGARFAFTLPVVEEMDAQAGARVN